MLEHKEQLFGHLRQRWQDLFGARFEVLLYDLTSTYFESDPLFAGNGQAPVWLQPGQTLRLRASGHWAHHHP